MRAPRLEDARGQPHGAPACEVDEHDARVEVVRSPHADALCLAGGIALACGGKRCRAEIICIHFTELPDAERIGIEVENARQFLRHHLRHKDPCEYAAVDSLARDPLRKRNLIQSRPRIIDVNVRARKYAPKVL